MRVLPSIQKLVDVTRELGVVDVSIDQKKIGGLGKMEKLKVFLWEEESFTKRYVQSSYSAS